MPPVPADSIKEHVLRVAQKLPASPQIFCRLGSLLNDVNADMTKVINLISIDSSLTGRVIMLSNSVYFRGGQPVQSLDEAIGRVGFREVHRMVGVAMTEQMFKGGLPAYKLTAEQVWENSVATALAMEVLAREVSEEEASAYTLGLLRSVGKLVLGRILEKEQAGVIVPEEADLSTWERARLSIDSAEAGAIILDNWKLPPDMHQGLRFHVQPEVNTDHGVMPALLHLACWVATQLGKGLGAESRMWEPTPERLEAAGLSNDDLRICISDTQEGFDELNRRLADV